MAQFRSRMCSITPKYLFNKLSHCCQFSCLRSNKQQLLFHCLCCRVSEIRNAINTYKSYVVGEKHCMQDKLSSVHPPRGKCSFDNEVTGKGKKRIRAWLHTYLAPTVTRTILSRLSLHHSSTSRAKVALKKALLTTWDVHARKMEANCSRNPDFPSSNSLSDSSTTSHSTLGTKKFSSQ